MLVFLVYHAFDPLVEEIDFVVELAKLRID